ncbi:Spo0E family sporulation regulatory protein-aspartic acid phosphatase [Ornithinibacillus sp. L9]|uniref:Spo0E family sporulation regulatory protein-aspartic acid phosphatase n=1 Tax=Ornithinibacillus caprae TaxID=2678566 RepID=A0A6N8FMT1_9BACI|nr:Spo0E family sporulation regulatory protein-aspartic acid phosphatase [Ornithinibacillus caprae]
MENILLKKIEKCRREMIALSFSHGLTSEAVVQTSKRLDALLNEYQRKKVG